VTDADREGFAAFRKAWSAAIVDNDAAAIDAYIEPEWILVGETGIHARKQFLATVASGDLTPSR